MNDVPAFQEKFSAELELSDEFLFGGMELYGGFFFLHERNPPLRNFLRIFRGRSFSVKEGEFLE